MLPPLAAEQFGLFTYQVIGGATVTITDYPTSVAGPVAIPAEIDGKPVTSIGAQAFADCTLITSAFIPEDVISIADEAFSYCSGLASVSIPSTVTTIPLQKAALPITGSRRRG